MGLAAFDLAGLLFSIKGIDQLVITNIKVAG